MKKNVLPICRKNFKNNLPSQPQSGHCSKWCSISNASEFNLNHLECSFIFAPSVELNINE